MSGQETENPKFGIRSNLSTKLGFPHVSADVVFLHVRACLLLGGPVHELVSDEHRDGPVEDLALGSAVGVEDSGVCGASKSTLTVLGHGVGNDTTLRRGA